MSAYARALEPSRGSYRRRSCSPRPARGAARRRRGDAQRRRRSVRWTCAPPASTGLVVTASSSSFGGAGASGYPNNYNQIGNPDYFSSSNLMARHRQRALHRRRARRLAQLRLLVRRVRAPAATGIDRQRRRLPRRGVSAVRAVPTLKNLGMEAQSGSAARRSRRSAATTRRPRHQSFIGMGSFYEFTLFHAGGSWRPGARARVRRRLFDRDRAWLGRPGPSIRLLRREVGPRGTLGARESRDPSASSARCSTGSSASTSSSARGIQHRLPGTHAGLDEPIAIKCLKLPPTLGTALVDSFIRQFRTRAVSTTACRRATSPSRGAWQRHDHVVHDERAGPYMVLEWLDGRSLAQDFEVRRVQGGKGRRSPRS